MIHKITLILISLFVISPALGGQSEIGDFETLCTIFGEAIEFESGSIQERADYISEQVDIRISSREVTEIYYALFNVAPGERYNLLAEAAEHYTHEKWNCLPAKQLME